MRPRLDFSSSNAQPQPPSSQDEVAVPEASSIAQHEFSNGLVLLAEMMPGVQSVAFTLLLPAGAAYEVPDRGGAATMLSEWITRGAGDRDSHELLAALDNLGVHHGESAQGLHTSLSAATLGRNLIPVLELFADIVLRPHLDDEEVEPIRAWPCRTSGAWRTTPAPR